MNKTRFVYVLSEEYDERFEGIYSSLAKAKRAVTSDRWKRIDGVTWKYAGLSTIWVIQRVILR